jgi:hypothetical protein
VENEKNVVFVIKQARTPHLNEFEPAHFNQYGVLRRIMLRSVLSLRLALTTPSTPA